MIKLNARDLNVELSWLQQVLSTRALLNNTKPCEYKSVYEVSPPSMSDSVSEYARFVKDNNLNFEERLLLIMALAPHIKPEILDCFLQNNNTTSQTFTEFGGRQGRNHGGFLPTGETAVFILAKDDLEKRFALARYFSGGHIFSRKRILKLDDVERNEPQLGGALVISHDALSLFTQGETEKPGFSSSFPAHEITTEMEWDDLVLSSRTLTQLHEIELWVRHRYSVACYSTFRKKIRAGYAALCYGPSGCGKTVATALIGKRTGYSVYLCDLAFITSKYIGDTEKALANLFDRAEEKNWILYFDEGETLFTHRSEGAASDAGMHHANNVTGYLLHRLEKFSGLVMVSTNLRNRIDNGFLRRFQSIIHFPMPGAEERERLWRKAIPTEFSVDGDFDLKDISRKYELAGGSIVNVLQYCALHAVERGEAVISREDLMEGIRKEFNKMGRTM